MTKSNTIPTACKTNFYKSKQYLGDSVLKSRYITLLTKVCIVRTGFSGSQVPMWELDHKKSWAAKNCCFCIVVLEKTIEGALNCKEIKPVNSKGDQPWIFFGRTDAEAPIFGCLMRRANSLKKDSDPGKEWKQKGKGVGEDEMVR